jgi:hypothetical protein
MLANAASAPLKKATAMTAANAMVIAEVGVADAAEDGAIEMNVVNETTLSATTATKLALPEKMAETVAAENEVIAPISAAREERIQTRQATLMHKMRA